MSQPAQLLTNGPALRLPSSLRLDAATRMLDIGCGRGALLRALDDQLHFDTPPVGVDFSRAALALAARGAPVTAPRLVGGSASALPFRDGAFTLVTCGYLAKHLADDELLPLFAETRRVLAPGGLAVVWEFGPSGDRRLDAWNSRVLSVTSRAPRLRSSATLRRVAAEAGFEFTRDANLRPFLLPPIARASVLVGRPPEGWRERQSPAP
ncbi:MAG: class I SAM-dependent methyltransferase [Chloroflexi bacterium]|nr:class I SAM-dependent methyltransferase [Chloroflexota bacterium]